MIELGYLPTYVVYIESGSKKSYSLKNKDQ